MTKSFGPRDQSAVAGNLIMLDRLRIGDDGRIEDRFVFNLARVAFASLIRPSMAGQSVPLGCLPSLANTLSRRSIWFCVSITCDLRPAFRSALVASDAICGMAFKLLFRVIDVLQLMQEQIIHRFSVICENSHSPR